MYKSSRMLLVLMFAVSSGVALAQATLPPPGERRGPSLSEGGGEFSGLPLDLLPPGARALALGGAFTAVADDATAALANPAGLSNLSAPEVSVFFRYSDADVGFLDPDAYNSGLFAEAGELNKTFSDSVTGVSYASFVLPEGDFVLSGFYSNQIDFNSTQTQPDIYFDDIERDDPEYLDDLFGYFDQYTNDNSVDATVESFGLSAAYRVTDAFSVGITLRYVELELNSHDSFQLDWWNDYETDLAVYFPEDPSFIDDQRQYLLVVQDTLLYQSTIDDVDKDLAIDAGLFYKGEKWSLGLAYHDGTEFKLAGLGSLSTEYGCSGDPTNERVENCEFLFDVYEQFYPDFFAQASPPSSESVTQTVVKIPSVVSLGGAFRPAETWLVAIDINWINYSVLTPTRSLTQALSLDINCETACGEGEPSRADFYDTDINGLTGPITEPIEDATTFHLGVEKSFIFETGVLRTLALRGGAFTVEDHDGIVATDDDETVLTVGLGSTWGKYGIGEKVFQVDLGASFANDLTTVVLSGIFRF